MISYLKGKVLSPNTILVNDGVGYRVETFEPLTIGEQVELLVTTIVREDAFLLYGFKTNEGQSFFEALVKVNGVGPSLALKILSTLGIEKAYSAIKNKDIKALTKTPGLGPKTTNVLVSSINLPVLDLDEVEPSNPMVENMAKSLVSMGYDTKLAEKAAEEALSETSDLGQAFKLALNFLKESK